MKRGMAVLWVLLCFVFAVAGCGSGGGGNTPGSGGGDTSGGGGDTGGGTGAIAAKVDITSDMYTQSSAYTLNGTVDPAVTSATISLNGGTAQSISISENAFSIPLTLKSGYNTLSITSTDSSGTTGTTVNYITYDTGQPSSLDLINNALNAGTITSEEALIYKTYAAFNDSRLPTEYKGDDSLADYSEITWEINEAYPTLSETAKEVLTPFLIPPFYKGSWHDIQKSAMPSSKSDHQNSKAVSSAAGVQYCEEMFPADWLSVGRGHIKVWYLEKYKDTDGKKASLLATFLEDTVWSELTTLMGRKPLSDIDMGCNGGDGRLDIALVDNIGNPGRTTMLENVFMGYGAEETPVYILINRNEDLNENFPTAVHEFMHAIQYGINVKSLSLNNDYATLMESTADWAAYYILKKVMKTDSTWHHKSLSFPSSFLQNTDKPYDTKDLNAFPYSESLLALYPKNRS